MNKRTDITIRIDLETYKQLRGLKKKTGASIKWLANKAVRELLVVSE